MNTLIQMLLATSLFVMAQMANAVSDQRIADCLSDYVLDWESTECAEVRHMGGDDYNYDDEYDEHELVAKIIIVYDPVEGDAKPIVIIGDD